MGQPKPGLLHIVLSLGAGGTERLVIDMCRRLADAARIKVACLDAAGEWASELTAHGIEVVALNRRAGFRPALAVELRSIARAMSARTLHCHHYSPFIYGCLAGLSLPGTRVIYTEHGRLSDGAPSAKRRVANTLFGHTPGRFFAVSRDLRRHMLAEGFPAGRVGVVHNGIAPGPLPTEDDRHRARAVLGLAPSDWVMGSVARLDPVKDLRTLLESTAVLASSIPELRLVLVGDGPERGALTGQAEALGLRDRLVFAGQRDDARALLSAFDVYVNCSVIEGISVTILEAMAARLPVVATAVGGTPEVLVHEQDALTVPARSAQALAAAVCRIHAEPGLARQLATAGRHKVEGEFSLDAMLAGYRSAYGW